MRYSGKIINITFLSLMVFSIFYCISDLISENEFIVLENFEGYKDANNILDVWMLRDGNKSEALNTYKISAENNNKFLTAWSIGNSVQIAKKIKWDIKSFPVLSWRWRATALPADANEEARGKNDSGASIYVIFQRSRIPFLPWQYQPVNVIKYVWSTMLPMNKIVYKNKTKAGKIIYEGYFFVVESGAGNSGKWITEERNVVKDYMKVFGKAPSGDPFLIAVLSDSNDTKSVAIADYDDIIIKKNDK